MPWQLLSPAGARALFPGPPSGRVAARAGLFGLPQVRHTTTALPHCTVHLHCPTALTAPLHCPSALPNCTHCPTALSHCTVPPALPHCTVQLHCAALTTTCSACAPCQFGAAVRAHLAYVPPSSADPFLCATPPLAEVKLNGYGSTVLGSRREAGGQWAVGSGQWAVAVGSGSGSAAVGLLPVPESAPVPAPAAPPSPASGSRWSPLSECNHRGGEPATRRRAPLTAALRRTVRVYGRRLACACTRHE
jgi:hypothetical protein